MNIAMYVLHFERPSITGWDTHMWMLKQHSVLKRAANDSN